jgi:hypothetical protein
LEAECRGVSLDIARYSGCTASTHGRLANHIAPPSAWETRTRETGGDGGNGGGGIGSLSSCPPTVPPSPGWDWHRRPLLCHPPSSLRSSLLSTLSRTSLFFSMQRPCSGAPASRAPATIVRRRFVAAGRLDPDLPSPELGRPPSSSLRVFSLDLCWFVLCSLFSIAFGIR